MVNIPLMVAWLVLTPRCNNRCLQCYYGQQRAGSKDMPLDFAKKVLSLIAQLGAKTCVLIGGEPTRYKELDQVIEFGSSHGLEMSMVTNGSLFSDEKKLQQSLNIGLHSYSVSIEGPDSETHDGQTRRKGSFSEVLQALKNGVKLGARVASITTLSASTNEKLIEIYRNVRKTGVSTVVINVCTPSLDLSNNECLLEPKVAAQKLEELFLLAQDDIKKKKVKVKLVTPLPVCLFSQDVVPQMRELGFLRKGCGCQMFRGIGVAFNYDGNVLPCCHWIGCGLTNIFDRKELLSFEEFKRWWLEDEPAEFRKQLTKYPSAKCVDCAEWGSHCIGGCPLFWLAHNAQECISGLRAI